MDVGRHARARAGENVGVPRQDRVSRRGRAVQVGLTRDLHSFRFQLNMSFSVHRLTQLNS